MPSRIAKRLPDSYLTATQIDADTVIYVYTNGWWKFHVEYSLDDDTTGISVSILLNDSVQFLTASQTPQIAPNELTETFLHRGDITLEVSIDGDSLGTFGVGIGGENDFTVTGMNDENVVVNGSTDAAIDFAVTNDSIDADISMDFFGDVDNVVTANAPNSCPHDGNFTLGFGMDFDVTQGDEELSASGEWEVHVEFLGDGMAHVEVHAEDGDFELDGEQAICEPEE